MPLPPGIDVEVLTFLESHEACYHAMPGREIRELGDGILLHDPIDREPFWNRLSAIRWPAEPAAFDRRLAEAISLFGLLDRIPHVWPRPALNEPADLVDRLLAAGFDDAGGGHVMVLSDRSAPARELARPLPPGVVVERLHRLRGDRRSAVAAELALVLGEAFSVEPDRRGSIEAETAVTFERDDVHACLVRVDGEPAAAAKRATFDGASYLSSIGTRPAYRGRGLGSLVTAIVAADAVDAGSRWIHLGVFTENLGAIRIYERLGFERIGDTAPDLLLR